MRALFCASGYNGVLSRPLPAVMPLPSLSLYVHLPWCVRKCPYCDFNSHGLREPAARALPEDVQARYLAALLADLRHSAAALAGRTVVSIFFGGGTPSLFAPAHIGQLLEAVAQALPLAPDVEITLEANPGTFEAERFRGYRAAGVNRLSLGIQSFDNQQLAHLGRIHSSQDAHAAIGHALAVFPRVNLDLMHALPAQTVAAALADLETALATGATHLSCYQLTLEPNTPFGHTPPAHLPDHDATADITEALLARLADAGFEHYETSAHARPGQRCRHNLNYWQFGDYLGIGAGAHGKLTLADGRIVRETRPKHPDRYQATAERDPAALATRTEVPPADLPFEFMMNALRLCDGVPLALFAERTGLAPETLSAPLARARSLGLLADDPAHLRPTPRGQAFLNDLVALFLPAEA